jgi:hypothetical protein
MQRQPGHAAEHRPHAGGPAADEGVAHDQRLVGSGKSDEHQRGDSEFEDNADMSTESH